MDRNRQEKRPVPYGLLKCVFVLFSANAMAGSVEGVREVWHTVSVSFDGPHAIESDPSTFLDHRLTVTFSQGESQFVVPGYFAADGQAGKTHAAEGNQWRVLFTPNRPGTWAYEARLEVGSGIAVSDEAGEAVELDSPSGQFEVLPSRVDPQSIDFRGKGRLRYVGQHYPQFEGSLEYFIRGGLGSPENLLAFDGIDGTRDFASKPEFPSLGEDQLHHFGPHRADWNEGDPLWVDEDGQDSKGLIGHINYAAEQGLNSVYLMPFTYHGDGWDVWPWIDPEQRTTFDVSKLDQWLLTFEHMQQNGLHVLMLLSETENENLFELRDGGGPFADTRKLYYREMVARFGHLLALTWDLGEENGWDDELGGDVGKGNTHEQRKLFSAWIRDLDPWDTPIKAHEIGNVEIYPQLAGFEAFEGPTLQRHEHYNQVIIDHLQLSRQGGRPWLVSQDEPLGWEFGLRPDADDPDHDSPRKDVLWGTLMAGGSGVSWYFGWQNNAPTSDLSSEDLRVRESMWRQNRIALEFFHRYLPFQRMQAANDRVEGDEDYVFAEPGKTYVVYLKNGGTAGLNLADTEGVFDIRWYDPKRGGALQLGTVRRAEASSKVSLGYPPHSRDQDWAVLLKRRP